MYIFSEFSVYNPEDKVQNDKDVQHPPLNFFIGDTFLLIDSTRLNYIVKDSSNKVRCMRKSMSGTNNIYSVYKI